MQSIELDATSYGETETIGIGTNAINAGVAELIGLVSGESSPIAAIGEQRFGERHVWPFPGVNIISSMQGSADA